MEKKQTAIHWLVETINNKIDYIPIKYWDSIRDIVQQAKEIEKEQIIQSYDAGLYDTTFCEKVNAEQYYNEIYKSE